MDLYQYAKTHARKAMAPCENARVDPRMLRPNAPCDKPVVMLYRALTLFPKRVTRRRPTVMKKKGEGWGA